MKVVIDGSCIKTKKFNGAQRYAMEILRELDKLVPTGKYELLIRHEYRSLICLHNIEIVEIKAPNKLAWGLKVFFYLFRNNAVYVHLTNGFTLWRKSIIT